MWAVEGVDCEDVVDVLLQQMPLLKLDVHDHPPLDVERSVSFDLFRLAGQGFNERLARAVGDGVDAFRVLCIECTERSTVDVPLRHLTWEFNDVAVVGPDGPGFTPSVSGSFEFRRDDGAVGIKKSPEERQFPFFSPLQELAGLGLKVDVHCREIVEVRRDKRRT